MAKVDLLTLDDACCVPNHLRRKWIALYEQDPLRAAQQYDRGVSGFVVSTGLLLLLGICIFRAWWPGHENKPQDPSAFFFLIGVATAVVLFFISGFTRLIRYRESGQAFRRAIVELAGFLETALEHLDGYSLHELETKAEQSLIKIAMEILKLEEESKIDAARKTRDLFKLVHGRFRSFALVAAEWDHAFKKAKDKLTQATPPVEPWDDPSDVDLSLRVPLHCEPNGGQPSAGILDLIREGNDVPGLTPNVAPEST